MTDAPLQPSDKIFIAGHRGMVGSALVRRCGDEGYGNLLTQTSAELDLTDQAATRDFFQTERPDVAIIAAAKVGGIHANNTYPATFAQVNLAIALNTIHAAYEAGVRRLLFLGSSCIYPRLAEQPIREESLLTGPLEQTNEAYAVAKITGLKLCEYYMRQYGVCFFSAMPTNLYGAGDNYHPENSHVMPAFIRRFYEAAEGKAPEITLWGTGSPRREFLHVDDLAAACLHLLRLEKPPSWLNVGTGEDISIRDLAELMAEITGYAGKLVWDTSRPDGTPRKLLDVARLHGTGWRHSIGLREGISATLQDFIANRGSLRL